MLTKAILYLFFLTTYLSFVSANDAGKTKFIKKIDTAFDKYTVSPNASTIQFANDKFYRIVTYAGYWDSKTWYSKGWFIIDAYGIAPDDFNTMKNYILKDSSGNYLWVPWGCSSGVCLQYAGDISNPNFRTYWLNKVQATLNTGNYKGIFIDDVNLHAVTTSTGDGNWATPYDPQTSADMTFTNWKKYFAEFLEFARAQVDSQYEIVHNSVFYAEVDTYVQRGWAAADYQYRQSGVLDAGITGGTGMYSLYALLSWVDQIHSLGKHVIFAGIPVTTTQELYYNFAAYLLINDGLDGHDNSQVDPDHWFPIYDTDFGSALGDRYAWQGAIRRDFTNAIVLVNEPGAYTLTLDLGETLTTPDGTSVTSVTLPASSGMVLLRSAPVTDVTSTTGSAASTTGSSSTTGSGIPMCSTNGLFHAKFAKRTSTPDDSYLSNPDESTKQWMNDHWYRMISYTPYFDQRGSWYGNAWFYYDSYAIYTSNPSGQEQWILKDIYGNNLYIPWGCGGGTCPQYAADISNPDFRQFWIDSVNAALSRGNYKGIWIDDVNLQGLMTCNGNGDLVAPLDRNTGTAMTFDDWRRYFAEYMEQVRSQIPSKYEIVHNSLWFGGPPSIRDADPYVQRQWASATFLNKEFGMIENGFTGGNGEWSIYSFFAYVDRVHNTGKHIILQPTIDTIQQRDYNLACYFLITDGYDCHDNTQSTPGSWWWVYDTDLGDVQGPRYMWNGLYRRDFATAIVLVNEPGAATVTVQLDGVYKNYNGEDVTSVSLGAESGTILWRSQPLCVTGTNPNGPNTPWEECGSCPSGQSCVSGQCMCADGSQDCVSSAGLVEMSFGLLVAILFVLL